MGAKKSNANLAICGVFIHFAGFSPRELLDDLRKLPELSPTSSSSPSRRMIDFHACEPEELASDVRGREPLDLRRLLVEADPALRGPRSQTEEV